LHAFTHLPHASLTLFKSELVQVGITRCPAEHPDFSDPGPIQRHVIYMGGSAVQVERPGGQAFLSGSATVSFHNQGECVKRNAARGAGDYSNWFVLAPELLFSTLAQLQPRSGLNESHPFQMTTGPCSSAGYLRQKRLIQTLQAGVCREPLGAEEGVLLLYEEVLSAALRAGSPGQPTRSKTARRHRSLVEHTKLILSQNYRQNLKLATIANSVGTSAFHLARVFRAQTGWSLHAYRTQMRLNTALDAVWEGADDLTQLALELGFSSHSHFTSSFKNAFGSPPSKLRSTPRRPRAQF